MGCAVPPTFPVVNPVVNPVRIFRPCPVVRWGAPRRRLSVGGRCRGSGPSNVRLSLRPSAPLAWCCVSGVWLWLWCGGPGGAVVSHSIDAMKTHLHAIALERPCTGRSIHTSTPSDCVNRAISQYYLEITQLLYSFQRSHAQSPSTWKSLVYLPQTIAWKQSLVFEDHSHHSPMRFEYIVIVPDDRVDP